MKSSQEIRQKFLDYFAKRGHKVVASSSLVPVNDPTLLFTNAGMNQFKDVFLGIDRRDYVRAVTAQKCVRAGGKHNDLDTVGRTARHHTFFEMLGNFSFGDYFKTDAIKFAWEFLTKELGLPPEKLWITIYTDDDEAYDIWHNVIGIRPERILRLGEKDNFWSMGDTGPCGPCSEIHYDRGADYACGHDNCALGVCDCDRWLELWNLVFMQFNRDEKGVMTPLPRPSIDTGMGLERIASVLQQVDSNFDTDLFTPLLARVEELTGRSYNRGDKGFPFRVIADHSRACTFLIADGVLPSNEGRGYVLRRILRRAVRFGKLLDLEEPFLYKMVATVVALMGAAFPEILEKQAFIEDIILSEEQRFLLTLSEGLKKVQEIIETVRAEQRMMINGEEAFLLYDTYGFPLDLTEDIAEENQLTVDQNSFNAMMEQQRERAKQANKGDNAFAYEQNVAELLNKVAPTDFVGYDTCQAEGTVQAIIRGDEITDTARDEQVVLVLDKTAFYAESGGQVADKGEMEGLEAHIRVLEVQKLAHWFLHLVEVKGTIRTGESITLCVEQELRLDTARNHSATHLLHKALQLVLGSHAQQKGSLVAPDYLRFDFSHLKSLTEEELRRVEDLTNAAIRSDYPVSTDIASLDEAKQLGATALFGEKYGDRVRMVKMGDYSLELCGGTHVQRTGEIGLCKILTEGSVGSGLRRIEAVTGRGAFAYLRGLEEQLQRAAALLKTTPEEVPERVVSLNHSLKEKDREIDQLKRQLTDAAGEDILEQVKNVGGFQVLIAEFQAEDADQMRDAAEKFKDKLEPGVVVLGAVIGDKVALAAFAGKTAVQQGIHVGKIIGKAAKAAGGGGGGRPDMAQAGGKDTARLAAALATAAAEIDAVLM